MGLPEDIYDDVDSCETAQEIWLRVEQVMKGSSIEAQEKKAKLFNDWEKFNSTEGESIESYYHPLSKLMNDFFRNKHFSGEIASNLKQIAQPCMNMGQDRQMQMVVQNAVQNSGVRNVENQNGLIVVLGIANQNGNGNVIATQAEGNGDIEEVNANYILMANLQQASTSGTQTDKAPVYDSDGSACDTRDLISFVLGNLGSCVEHQ
ncbi:hypothetical protein Tco_0699143, partial [Tanacetum coccineum]